METLTAYFKNAFSRNLNLDTSLSDVVKSLHFVFQHLKTAWS
jgi:hypothetical protein